MVNYDYPSENELNPNSKYDYDTKPTEQDAGVGSVSGTYDQFIRLRDTFVYTRGKYAGKAGCKLVVGDKEETIEILWNNIFQQNFESITDWGRTDLSIGPYVEFDYSLASGTFNTPLCCVIKKDGRYKLLHKEEVLLSSTTDKVFCYIDVYRPDGNGGYTMPYPGGVAVFDWEGAGGDYMLGELFSKMTASGYMERNLLKGDVLVLRAKDASSPDGLPAGNDLTLQTNSNYRSIEYLNLPYNN